MRYEIISGKLFDKNGTLVGVGYSGNGQWKNNPKYIDLRGKGPIPIGVWDMKSVGNSPNTGPFTIVLEPFAATNTYGRTEFRMHGDSISSPGSASHGCIIMARPIREAAWNGGDHILTVTSGLEETT